MVFYFLIVGLLIGSFGNSVVYRFPLKLLREWKLEAQEILGIENKDTDSILSSKRSFCPCCSHTLSWYDLIPLFSWLQLRGKCRYCKSPISVKYPFLELAGAVLAGISYYKFGVTLVAVGAFVFAILLLWLSAIDLEHMLLPDSLVYPLLWCGLLCATQNLFITPVDAILGTVIGYSLLAVPAKGFELLTGRVGMGGGDFKLLAAIGAFVGPLRIWEVMFLGAVSSIIIHLVMGLFKKADLQKPMPFGPSLAVGGYLIFLGCVDVGKAIAPIAHVLGK